MNCDLDYSRQALQKQAGFNNHTEFYSIREFHAGQKTIVSVAKLTFEFKVCSENV